MRKNLRRTGLLVPVLKLCQLDIIRIFHRFEPVVGGGGLAIMAFKVEFHPLLKARFSKDGMEHSNNFCALFVDSDGVEVIDLNVG